MASSMTQAGGGSGSLSSPWQKPSSINTSPAGRDGRQETMQRSRGYAVQGANKSRRSSVKNQSRAIPPDRHERQDLSYYQKGARHDNNFHPSRNRERDGYQHYRRNSTEYQRNDFEAGQTRSDDDRERTTYRGQGYADRPQSYGSRPMNGGGNEKKDRNDRRYESGYDEPGDSPYNLMNNRRPKMDGGSSNHNDRRIPTGRIGYNPGNDYRYQIDHRNIEQRGSYGREHERERLNDRLDLQRPSHGDHHNDSDRYRSRFSMGTEDRNNGVTEHEKSHRGQYNADKAMGQQQRPRQPERRWAAQSIVSKGDDYSADRFYERGEFSNHSTPYCDRRAEEYYKRNWEGNEPQPSRRNRGMWHPEEGRRSSTDNRNGDRRPAVAMEASRRGIHDGSGAEWNHRERESFGEHNRSSRENRSHPSHAPREEQQSQKHGGKASASDLRPATSDTRSKIDGLFDAIVSSDTKIESPSGKYGENVSNDRKRHLEDNGESKIALTTKVDGGDTSIAEHEVTRAGVLESSASMSDSIDVDTNQISRESKKAKLSAGISPSPPQKISTNGRNEVNQKFSNNDIELSKTSSSSLSRAAPFQKKMNGKQETKIPLKSSSSFLTKKHQISAKPKPTNKLGIPMGWLKPKVKPKIVKKASPNAPDDTSKSLKVPLKSASSKKSSTIPSSPSNRLVTDSSEDSSIMSFKNNRQIVSSSSNQSKKQSKTSVPGAIVTKKTKKASRNKTKQKSANAADDSNEQEDEWDSQAESEESDGDNSDSESDTDDDEVLEWASKMLGVPASPSSIDRTDSNDSLEPKSNGNQKIHEVSKPKSPKLKIRLSAALKLKLSESVHSSDSSNGLTAEDGNKLEAALKKLERRKKKQDKMKALSERIGDIPMFDHEKAKMEIEEDRRKREEAKPLTAKEIRKILQNDTSSGGDQNNWVRRSRRQPNMALLNSKPVRILVDKLKHNDTDMRVLKMKKYINDPNTPCAVMDAILNAMEENTNCEALYIQNFNEGMRDDQVIHLLRILQQPSCKIWCLNIGENYNVSDETWERFTKGLIHTKITHMYASEHTITSEMKDEIRFTIRENRKKHDMHINPNNLDVIIQCTHCWWNPINAKVLRPFLKKKGYETVLKDREAQGLKGSKSMAPTI